MIIDTDELKKRTLTTNEWNEVVLLLVRAYGSIQKYNADLLNDVVASTKLPGAIIWKNCDGECKLTKEQMVSKLRELQDKVE
jgi:hypothetical protein